MNDHTPQNIINLSNHKLTEHETNLLNKGLSFVPTPKITTDMITSAIEEFTIRIKRKTFFDNFSRRFALGKKQPFTNKSSWVPPDSKIHPDVLECINNFTIEIKDIKISSDDQNLTESEQLALKNLKSNHDIVIKKADKGAAVVMMDKESYLQEGCRQLNNPSHYKKLSEPIYPETALKITEILLDLKTKHTISDKQYAYLKPPENPRPHRFYMLPKIHKSKETWTIPDKMPKGRPIVSDCNSESEHVAEYIDEFIKHEATLHPAYLKNTEDFIDKIRSIEELPDDFILITMDVESMYTNIDHEKGLEAIRERMQHLSETHRYTAVLELLELSLKNNDFEFNGDVYLQILGTSMGKKWAPHYADIYMAKFENDALEKCPLKPHTYLRYLDDIFIIWTHGIKAFGEFLKIFNTHQLPIKFKAEINSHSVDFLDTTIFRGDSLNPLKTKVYFKPTDTHQLLHKTSYHPKHTFKGLIKSQLHRFRKICTDRSDFEDAWSVLYQSLRKRNYPKRWLRKVKEQATHEIEQKAVALYEYPSVPSSASAGASQCRVAKCKTCPVLFPCQNFTSSHFDETHSIRSELDCNSSNIIYLYTCDICKEQYVGQTGNTLKYRHNRHRAEINKINKLRSALREDYTSISNRKIREAEEQSSDALVKHLCTKHPEIREISDMHFTLTPIEQVKDYEDKQATLLKRLELEQDWIKKLNCFEPYGMNVKQYNYKSTNEHEKKSSNILACIIPYSGVSSKIANIIKKHIQILQDKETLMECDFKTITAFSRHKNLTDYLVSSKLKS